MKLGTELYGVKAAAMLLNFFSELRLDDKFKAGLSRADNGEILVAFDDSRWNGALSRGWICGADVLREAGDLILKTIEHFLYSEMSGNAKLKMSGDARFGYRDYACVAYLLKRDARKIGLMKYDPAYVEEIRGTEYDMIRAEMESIRRREIEKLENEYDAMLYGVHETARAEISRLETESDIGFMRISDKYEELARRALSQRDTESGPDESAGDRLSDAREKEIAVVRAGIYDRMREVYRKREAESERLLAERDAKILALNGKFDAAAVGEDAP